jgi:uracil-DNA glycosylase
LRQLRDSARRCRRCDLYKGATQTVFGEGPSRAEMMFVGEQPGDSEDLEGRPFVGPAGKLLRRAMGEAGIDESAVYVTNAVKHFKHVVRGKRRIHATPKTIEIRACYPWLEGEVHAVRPSVIVALGATALHALLGSRFTVNAYRGRIAADAFGTPVFATVHPSSILRARDDRSRRDEMAKFVGDLKALRSLRIAS